MRGFKLSPVMTAGLLIALPAAGGYVAYLTRAELLPVKSASSVTLCDASQLQGSGQTVLSAEWSETGCAFYLSVSDGRYLVRAPGYTSDEYDTIDYPSIRFSKLKAEPSFLATRGGAYAAVIDGKELPALYASMGELQASSEFAELSAIQPSYETDLEQVQPDAAYPTGGVLAAVNTDTSTSDEASDRWVTVRVVSVPGDGGIISGYETLDVTGEMYSSWFVDNRFSDISQLLVVPGNNDIVLIDEPDYGAIGQQLYVNGKEAGLSKLSESYYDPTTIEWLGHLEVSSDGSYVLYPALEIRTSPSGDKTVIDVKLVTQPLP